jgi:hypothetical protein
MNIRNLLQEWEARYREDDKQVHLSLNLPVKHAARLKALAEMYPGRSEAHIMVDLLGIALDELEAALPYVQGSTVIAEDEFGDPLYDDVGPTPRFLALTQKYRAQLNSNN